jgi:glycosyltransferase involved in cell wall biosynthesis
MRIVLGGAEFGMTGAGLMLLRYGAYLVRAGHEVIVLPRPGETGPLEAGYRDAGIARASGDSLQITRETLLICNTLMSAPLVLQASAHAPTVWWLHEGEIGLDILAKTPSLAGAFNQAHLIVCPTPVLRDRIYRSFLLRVPEDRVAVIPYGVDMPRGARPARAPGPPRIAVIGSVYPRKRPLDLLRALERLAEVDLTLDFVGRNHGLEPEFDARAAAAGGRVRLHGEIDNAAAMAVLDQADALALPSGSECLPIAPIEAGMRGIPSVLSDLAGHEGVWQHGWNCLMHGVGDVALLAHMLRAMATDAPLRARLGAAARQTAQRFRTELSFAKLDLALAGLR